MSEFRKKLIEVALPLEAINKESAREKSIRQGHPSTLHLWWARRPLAACRAVLFSQMVDDPSSLPDEFPTEEAQETERQRLFHIIEEFVRWENTTNEVVLHKARVEIARSAARNHGVSLPRSMTLVAVADALKQYATPVLDPFAGGGSIPLEAQRLGLEAQASELNPVAVLINKAMIEIPPNFARRPPVNPNAQRMLMSREWSGAQGLADDIRYYGKWIRDEAERRIGYLYPKVTLPKEYSRGEARVVAWLWTRTVTCPNPACGAQMPLTRSFWLSTKKGNVSWIEPSIDYSVTPPVISFSVKTGKGQPPDPPKVGRGAQFKCLCCGGISSDQHIKLEGFVNRMGIKLMAIVAEGRGERIYLPASLEQEEVAARAKPQWHPEQEMPKNPRWFSPPLYGMSTYADIFTNRQLVALTTFSDLVSEVRDQVLSDAIVTGMDLDNVSFNGGGTGATAYADAISTYLGLAVSRCANTVCTLTVWSQSRDQSVNVFSRQGVPMSWDFPEVNPFAGAAGDFAETSESMSKSVAALPATTSAYVIQRDATSIDTSLDKVVISTDPPYYDNIGYADLSDFFYVWLRHSLNNVFPDLFSTMLVPKTQELVATPYRFGGDRKKAKQFFETGLGKAFDRMRAIQHPDYPLTIYYAFKQAETNNDEDTNTLSATASTGWETMLEALIKEGFTITGTWPMRTERPTGVKIAVNALASSIVLICRPRATDAPLITRRDFLNSLKRELPLALKDLQRGNIAPVDLAQAAIGPGMAVFSRYSNVLESDGTPMRVRTALQLINQMLDEVLAEQEGEYDADTRWAVAWFEQFGMDEGPYGVAETLSKAKNTALSALVESGILQANSGKARLLRRDEFSSDWNPATAKRLTVWEVTQRLIRALQEQGDTGTAVILDRVGAYGDVARDLAYRLYTVCEHKKLAEEALAYNSLVVEWSDISGAVEQLRRTTAEQASLFS